MSLAISLATMFGKTAAEKLLQVLGNRKNGSQRLEQAAAALTSGATAIEALKQAFGKDFLSSLNEVLGASQGAFSYEAGTQQYIRQDADHQSPAQVLRDELNINLDRLTLLGAKDHDIRNQARGLVAVWGERCRELYGDTHKEEIDATLKVIKRLLNGDSRNYKQIYHLLLTTGLNTAGALMIISAALLATSTGVGVVTAISTFLFGIPLLTVGALILGGAILVMLANKKTRPLDDVSLCVALAYKLLGRLKSVD